MNPTSTAREPAAEIAVAEVPVASDPARLGPELHSVRMRVPGVRGCVVASLDGRPVAHSLDDIEPGAAAAVLASTLSLAQRVGELCGPGPLDELTVRSEAGYVHVYALGEHHVLAVLSERALNVARLGLEIRSTASTLVRLLRTTG